MTEPRAAERREAPLTGMLQGIVQTILAALFMLVGGSDPLGYGPPTRGPAFWCALVLVIVTLLGLGIVVDRRRARRPLDLVTPVPARRAILLVSVALPGVTTCAAALEQATSRGEALQAFVCTVLGGMLLGVPCIFVVIDRILGPAWVLAQTAMRSFARRRWSRCDVLEVDGERAVILDHTGTRLTVRTEQAMEPGPAYVVLTSMRMPAEPYREEDVRGNVERIESAADRAARRRDIVTAALSLVSGIAWLSPLFTMWLGDALTDWGPTRCNM